MFSPTRDYYYPLYVTLLLRGPWTHIRLKQWSFLSAVRRERYTGCRRLAVNTTCCWTLRGRSEVNFLHSNNTENTLHILSDGKWAANSVGVLQMYAAFGLGASLKKVLNFGNMLLYAEYVADDMEFPRELPSIQDDMFQVCETERNHSQ